MKHKKQKMYRLFIGLHAVVVCPLNESLFPLHGSLQKQQAGAGHVTATDPFHQCIHNQPISQPMIARSIREASALKQVSSLVLRRSEDLVCRNMLCEKVGEPCVCRLDLVLARIPKLQVSVTMHQEHRMCGACMRSDSLGSCGFVRSWTCRATTCLRCLLR